MAKKYPVYIADDLRLERQVADLDSVPEPYRDAYIDYEDGEPLTLCVAVAKFLHEGEAKLAALSKELPEKIVAMDAEIATLRKQNTDSKIASAIRAALTEAGVKPALQNAAVALLREATKFEVEEADDGDGHVVLADTPFGLLSVEGAVESFLESDDGEPFRSKRAAPSDGYFSSIVAGLKQRR